MRHEVSLLLEFINLTHRQLFSKKQVKKLLSAFPFIKLSGGFKQLYRFEN